MKLSQFLSGMKLKYTIILMSLIVLILIGFIIIQCHPFTPQRASTTDEEKIILGFSQIGAESAWRKYNSKSIKQAARENGIQLLFENAEQKQENQIKAIRSFISYQVDVIAFAPIVADGWDNILQEAYDAGIPVLVTDRKINTKNENLYAGYIGTDSEEEGREAARFLLKKFKDKLENETIETISILEMSGTEGSSPAVGRAAGFREIINEYPEFSIDYSISADFLRSKGYEVMNHLIKDDQHFDIIYSHNDGMTLGIIDALKENGIKPGSDIVLVSIDAEQAAIDALKQGDINCVIECNPRLGPLITELAEKLARGETIPRYQTVKDQVFTEYNDLTTLPARGY